MKLLTILLFILSKQFGYSQKKDVTTKLKFDKENFLKEVSDNACKCIDSIDTADKTKKDNAKAISLCIDKQTTVYQMGMKIASLNIDVLDEGKETKIEINTNSDSKEYKKYYYEIEGYLNSNCKSIKDKVATLDKENSKSVSSNTLALQYYNSGLEEYKKENYAKAIETFKKAIAVDEDFAFAYDNIGICYRKLNDFDKAIEYYEKSLKIDPNGLMPLQNISVAYIYKKEYKKAIKSYEKLASLDKENPEVYYGIGQVYFQYLNENEKALDNMCKAYNLYVSHGSPYRGDAEKIMQLIYTKMKAEGKEVFFNDILKQNKISPE